MFEFNISYLEQGYHKEGDEPFSFPPSWVDNTIDGNLIEIAGRNGTGKTTLLNVLALALGYLDQNQEDELDRKPALKNKLMQLKRNDSLEYDFKIFSKKKGTIDLQLKRTKGQTMKCWLNSRAIDLDTMNKNVDVVFLTEDDPKKVISASIGKLGTYFNTLERGTGSLQTALMKLLRDIDGFREFKSKEDSIIKDATTCSSQIVLKNSEFEKLSEQLKKLQLKDEIKEKLRLISEKEKISKEYKKLKKKFEQLCDKKHSDIARDLYRERSKLSAINNELKTINRQINQICESLRTYGSQLDEKKLQNNDYSELNALNEKLAPVKAQEAIKMQMIDDFLDILRHHLDSEIVPIIGKTVAETRTELMKLKAHHLSDRVFALARMLTITMSKKKKTHQNFVRKQNKISELIQKNESLKELGTVQVAYEKAEERYLELQIALNDDRSELLGQWEKVSLIEGDSESIKTKLHTLEIEISTQETLKNKYLEKLDLLRANSTGKPDFFEEEEKIKSIYQKVFGLKGSIARWMEILRDPEMAKMQHGKGHDNQGLEEVQYNKFVKAVGEYLGTQFEPIPFANKQHSVKFFDIEKNLFITTEERKIHIANLSQGQSKITSLNGIFKKMDPNKKKIVLIDEISELDPQNLQKVKENLKEKLDQGSLLLAVLVRPSAEILQIGKCD